MQELKFDLRWLLPFVLPPLMAFPMIWFFSALGVTVEEEERALIGFFSILIGCVAGIAIAVSGRADHWCVIDLRKVLGFFMSEGK